MIYGLRRKFIIVAMCSVFIVLAVIIAAINIANYVNVNREADRLLDFLMENEGAFGSNSLENDFSVETPYTSRYFYVVMSQDGYVLTCNTENVTAVSSDEAIQYATQLFDSGKTDGYGYKDDYRYRIENFKSGRWKVSTPSDTYIKVYMFLDWSGEMSSFRYFLFASISISIIGFLVVLVLLIIFSGIATKPVVDSYEKQKRFITNAGHELKTPITIIEANTDVLELSSGSNEWTDSIHNQVKRISDMTDELVLLTKTEEVSKKNFVEFSLSDAVEETVSTFVSLADSRERSICLKIDSGISYNGDEASIRHLVSIVMDNALKYSTDEDAICVELKATGRGATLSVTNHCVGLYAGNHDELFERFYRNDSSHNSGTEGHGIGLSIARSIAEMHGGKINARCEEDGLFIVTLSL